MSTYWIDLVGTKNTIELIPLVDHPLKPVQRRSSFRILKCLCLPVVLITIFATSCIVLSTEVKRRPCTITCIHRPNCTAVIGNHTFTTYQGSCSWREKTAECTCYKANGVVSVNPFILLSPMWTLLAVLSGGALALFTLGLACWCCCRPPEQTY